jgi:hypothetical protein
MLPPFFGAVLLLCSGAVIGGLLLVAFWSKSPRPGCTPAPISARRSDSPAVRWADLERPGKF